ncbi:hypothetical protein UlMin_028597 [Ulmus minor]
MVSLCFPFSFSQLPKPPHTPSSSNSLAISSKDPTNPKSPFFQNALNFFSNSHSLPLWGSLSLSYSSNTIVDLKTGVSFPSILADYLELMQGRRAFLGVYADNNDRKKYEKVSIADIIEKKELVDDLVESDISMTVRLQIIYRKLSIRSVRSVFEELVGSRLQKFGDQIKENCFKKLTKERAHVLRTIIDGKEVGSVESKLLCRSILDMYIGEDPFDKQAKEDVKLSLASLFQK